MTDLGPSTDGPIRLSMTGPPLWRGFALGIAAV
jgi:hypothetical protein